MNGPNNDAAPVPPEFVLIRDYIQRGMDHYEQAIERLADELPEGDENRDYISSVLDRGYSMRDVINGLPKGTTRRRARRKRGLDDGGAPASEVPDGNAAGD